MKKIIVIVTALSMVLSAAMMLTGEDGDSGSSSKEVVVKGQLKIKIETEKPEIEIMTDETEVAEKYVKTEEIFMGLAPEDIKDVSWSLPANVNEDRPYYHPEKSLLEELPVFRVSVKMPKEVELDRWTFKVTDPMGRVIKRETGGGGLPQSFEWDGFDENGKILQLAAPYVYSLSWMDKAGNPGITRSKAPKAIDAVKYKKDGKLNIAVTSKVLFQKKRKEQLADKGREIITEVQDYIKMSNSFPVDIEIYSEDTGLASDQERTLLKIMENDLKVPAEYFNVKKFRDMSVPKNYRVVFKIGS